MNPGLIVSFCILCCVQVHSQIYVSGTIIDNENKEPLSYVNIGIRHGNKGTCTLANGTFTLQLPESCRNDSLTFSMIGYFEQSIPLSSISNKEPIIIGLNKKQYELQEASVSAKKLREKKYGIKKYNPVLHFTDGVPNQKDIFEIAQLIHLEKKPSKITSLRLFINEPREDSGIFRINFYHYDGVQPTTKCVEQEIRQTKKIREGWLTFDLSLEKIYLKGDVIVSLEFMPGKTGIEYEVKLGGRTKSFFRQYSLGEWQTPPHHYRLYLTALTDTDKNEETDTDEEGAAPTLCMFSKAVGDSFSIFVKVPADYTKDPQFHYPVVYVTDGNAYFDLLSDAYETKQLILVGIGYSNAFEADSLRDRDYTWPKAFMGTHSSMTGGADRFFQFIRNELVPCIDTIYRTDTTARTLMGHSLGGYFTLYALKQDMEAARPVFTHYVSASPSLDYANGYLIDAYKILEEKNDHKKTVYITTGGREENNDFRAFGKLLGSGRFKNLEVKTKIFEKADHMHTPLPTFKKAMDK